jgi:hypothetical protein
MSSDLPQGTSIAWSGPRSVTRLEWRRHPNLAEKRTSLLGASFPSPGADATGNGRRRPCPLRAELRRDRFGLLEARGPVKEKHSSTGAYLVASVKAAQWPGRPGWVCVVDLRVGLPRR